MKDGYDSPMEKSLKPMRFNDDANGFIVPTKIAKIIYVEIVLSFLIFAPD